MEKSCRNYTPKASPRPLLDFDKQPKAAISCKKIVLKMRYFERGLWKSL